MSEERKIYKIPELSASDKRKLKIRKLYNTIDTLKKNELPSEESPKMVRQLSDEAWNKQIRSAASELDRLLKADGAKQQLSLSGQEAVTYGAPLSVAAKKLYTQNKNKKRKGGPVHKNKKPQMMHGGVHKGKKHTYATGGMVRDMKIVRKK
tara:strand:- start:164 stop:616 length:453 start_codon:yes stop_codon:yes gene_type:complete